MLLVANLVGDNEPVLGLDLQGGVSVVLSAEEDVTAEDLTVIRDLIRDELEDRGIAEPDVRVEGENVVVDLPGVRDQREALEAVDVTGIVQLRPVVQACTPPLEESATGTSVPDSTATAATEAAAESASTETASTESAPGSAGSASDEAASTVEPAATAASTESTPSGFRRADDTATSAADSTEATSSSSEVESSAPTDPSSPTESSATLPSESSAPTESSEPGPTTTTEPPLGPLNDNPIATYPATPYGPPPPPTDQTITELTTRDGWTCVVGPVELGPTGESGGQLFARGSASAVLDPAQGWIVRVDLTPEGRGTFNQLATACFTQQQNCPLGQLAIVLDDIVQSAPAVQQANFESTVTISGEGASAFAESQARSLARVLDRGAFPVQVRTESVQTVSPTLGEDSLQAAIFAALVGLVLVLLGLMYFYRRLIVVVMAGLSVWGTAHLLGVGDHLPDHQLRALPCRRHGDHRRHRHHRGQLRRLLRAPQGRGAPRAYRAQLGRAQLQGDVAHDHRRRPRVADRRRRALRPQRRVGARIRSLPRCHDGVRPDRVLVLHTSGGPPARRQRLARRR